MDRSDAVPCCRGLRVPGRHHDLRAGDSTLETREHRAQDRLIPEVVEPVVANDEQSWMQLHSENATSLPGPHTSNRPDNDTRSSPRCYTPLQGLRSEID